MDFQRLLPIPSRRKLRKGQAIVGQLLVATEEPETDNSTADAPVFSTRYSIVFWVLLDKSGSTSAVEEWGKVSRLAVTAAALSGSVLAV